MAKLSHVEEKNGEDRVLNMGPESPDLRLLGNETKEGDVSEGDVNEGDVNEGVRRVSALKDNVGGALRGVLFEAAEGDEEKMKLADEYHVHSKIQRFLARCMRKANGHITYYQTVSQYTSEGIPLYKEFFIQTFLEDTDYAPLLNLMNEHSVLLGITDSKSFIDHFVHDIAEAFFIMNPLSSKQAYKERVLYFNDVYEYAPRMKEILHDLGVLEMLVYGDWLVDRIGGKGSANERALGMRSKSGENGGARGIHLRFAHRHGRLDRDKDGLPVEKSDETLVSVTMGPGDGTEMDHVMHCNEEPFGNGYVGRDFYVEVGLGRELLFTLEKFFWNLVRPEVKGKMTEKLVKEVIYFISKMLIHRIREIQNKEAPADNKEALLLKLPKNINLIREVLPELDQYIPTLRAAVENKRFVVDGEFTFDTWSSLSDECQSLVQNLLDLEGKEVTQVGIAQLFEDRFFNLDHNLACDIPVNLYSLLVLGDFEQEEDAEANPVTRFLKESYESFGGISDVECVRSTSHLTDKAYIDFLYRCASSLKEGGTIRCEGPRESYTQFNRLEFLPDLVERLNEEFGEEEFKIHVVCEELSERNVYGKLSPKSIHIQRTLTSNIEYSEGEKVFYNAEDWKELLVESHVALLYGGPNCFHEHFPAWSLRNKFIKRAREVFLSVYPQEQRAGFVAQSYARDQFRHLFHRVTEAELKGGQLVIPRPMSFGDEEEGDLCVSLEQIKKWFGEHCLNASKGDSLLQQMDSSEDFSQRASGFGAIPGVPLLDILLAYYCFDRGVAWKDDAKKIADSEGRDRPQIYRKTAAKIIRAIPGLAAAYQLARDGAVLKDPNQVIQERYLTCADDSGGENFPGVKRRFAAELPPNNDLDDFLEEREEIIDRLHEIKSKNGGKKPIVLFEFDECFTNQAMQDSLKDFLGNIYFSALCEIVNLRIQGPFQFSSMDLDGRIVVIGGSENDIHEDVGKRFVNEYVVPYLEKVDNSNLNSNFLGTCFGAQALVNAFGKLRGKGMNVVPGPLEMGFRPALIDPNNNHNWMFDSLKGLAVSVACSRSGWIQEPEGGWPEDAKPWLYGAGQLLSYGSRDEEGPSRRKFETTDQVLGHALMIQRGEYQGFTSIPHLEFGPKHLFSVRGFLNRNLNLGSRFQGLDSMGRSHKVSTDSILGRCFKIPAIERRVEEGRMVEEEVHWIKRTAFNPIHSAWFARTSKNVRGRY